VGIGKLPNDRQNAERGDDEDGWPEPAASSRPT
jgi:hypothetical protein